MIAIVYGAALFTAGNVFLSNPEISTTIHIGTVALSRNADNSIEVGVTRKFNRIMSHSGKSYQEIVAINKDRRCNRNIREWRHRSKKVN